MIHLFLVRLLLQIQVTLKLLYVILWERKTRLFTTLLEARQMILHARACALIKEMCVSSDGFSITSHTVVSLCEMKLIWFDLTH